MEEIKNEDLEQNVNPIVDPNKEEKGRVANKLALQRNFFKGKTLPLKRKEDDKILSIQYFKSLVLAGNLAVEDVCAIKRQDKDGNIEFAIMDRDVQTIATVREDYSIDIKDEFLQQYEAFIGKRGEQTPGQREIYDFEEPHVCKQIEGAEEAKKLNIKAIKAKAAVSNNCKTQDIVAIVEVKNKAELGAVLDQDIPSVCNAYIIKFSDGSTRICIEQGETMKPVASDIHTRQIEDALGKNLDMNKLDGTGFRANEFRAAENKETDNQLVVIDYESNDRDKVISTDGATGRVRTAEFIKNDDGKMVEVKGSVKHPSDIELETDLENYVQQDTDMDEAMEALNRLAKIEEAQAIMAEIQAIMDSDLPVKDKVNMSNQKQHDLADVLGELGIEYNFVDIEDPDETQEVAETLDGEEAELKNVMYRGERLTPEEEALKKLGY